MNLLTSAMITVLSGGERVDVGSDVCIFLLGQSRGHARLNRFTVRDPSRLLPDLKDLLSMERGVNSEFQKCLDTSVNRNHIPCSPRHHEGTLRIVTERWRGLRWTLWRQVREIVLDEDARSVRRSRVVLAPRPWRLSGPPVRARQR
jgi:hypothetical protein